MDRKKWIVCVKQELKKMDKITGMYLLCNIKFTIKHDKKIKCTKINQLITSYFPKTNWLWNENQSVSIFRFNNWKKNSLLQNKAIAENIIAPNSIQVVLDELGINNGKLIQFSLANDASNKGNRKMLPIAVYI